MITPADMQTKVHGEGQVDLKPLTLFVSFPTTPLTDHLPNGDGLIAFKFIQYLAGRGYRIYLATPRADLNGPLPEHVQLFQMNSRADQPPPGPIAYMRWSRKMLREIYRRESIDLIHELNPVFSLRSVTLSGFGVPVVLGPYSSRWPNPVGDTPLRKARLAVRAVVKDAVVSLQQLMASGILLSTPAALNNVVSPERMKGKLFRLSPGLDTDFFSPAESGPAECMTILFLANVSERKGISSLLDAFSLVTSRLPLARLIIAGGGEDLPRIKRQVEASPYRERVELIGHVSRSQVPEVMRRCAVYCLPSNGEPFGMTAIEAMACGKPLVVTRAGGLAFMVSDQGGRRVPVGDPRGLAAALIDLLSDSELCRSMGAHNRMEAERKYAWPIVGRRLERIYASVLGLKNAVDEDRVSAADIDSYRSMQRGRRDCIALGELAASFDQTEKAYE